MSDRFYTPDPLVMGEYVLGGAEAHHLAAVRRIGPGGRIVLFNGDGRDYPAEVRSVSRRSILVNVLGSGPNQCELPFRLDIAAAMPKGDRGEFLIEKLTELGTSRFTPLLTARTVVEPKASRLVKLRQVVIEASKQCGRSTLMGIEPLTRWADVVNAPALPGLRVILHPDGDTRSLAALPRDALRAGGVVFAVGPEGGLTTEEVMAAQAAGWQQAALGTRLLRIETAAIAAAAWASLQ